MTSPLRSALAAFVVLWSGSALAAPRSVSDCESLKNDLAYNQCLAMFGPEARNVGGGDGGSPSMPAATASAGAALPMADEPAAQTRRGRHGRHRYGRHGRQVAAFAIGGDESPRSHRRRRRY